jgi:hypothetical protein
MSKNTIYIGEDQQNSFSIIETTGLFEAIFYGMFDYIPDKDELDIFVDSYVEHISFYDNKSSDEKCKKLVPLIQKFYDELEQDMNPILDGTYKDIFKNEDCSTQIAAFEQMEPYKRLRLRFGSFIKTLKHSNFIEYEYIICKPTSELRNIKINIVEKKSANNYVVRNSYSPDVFTENTKTIFILHTENKYFSLRDTKKESIKTTNVSVKGDDNKGNNSTTRQPITSTKETKGKVEEDMGAFFDTHEKELDEIISGTGEKPLDVRMKPKKLTDTKPTAVNISPNPVVQDPTIETIAPFTIKYTIDNEKDLKDLPSTQSAIMRAFKSGKVSTATSIGAKNSPSEQSVRSKVNTTIRNNSDFQGLKIDNIALVNSKNIVAELPTNDWYFKVNLTKKPPNTGGLRANNKKTQKLKKKRKTQKRIKCKKKSNKSKRRK